MRSHISLHAGTTCGDLNITHDILMITSEDIRQHQNDLHNGLTKGMMTRCLTPSSRVFLTVGGWGDPPPSVNSKKKLGSWKVAIWGDSLVGRWIEEMKRSILSPFPGGRGNSLRRYSTFLILPPPSKFHPTENPGGGCLAV